jgi:hypothetical protein
MTREVTLAVTLMQRTDSRRIKRLCQEAITEFAPIAARRLRVPMALRPGWMAGLVDELSGRAPRDDGWSP